MKPKVKDIIRILENNFPLDLAEEWDNAGLQVGSSEDWAERVLVCLDITESVIKKAEEDDINLIITHHPLIFKPFKRLNLDQPAGNIIGRLVKKGINVYSAHTNLDAGTRGLNQILAERLGLKDIKPLDQSKTEKYVKLAIFVPASHVEIVRQAINNAGAGFIGNYSDCSFRTRGTGTFKPLPGTNPFIGTTGQLEEADEYRLETIAAEKDVSAVISAMKKVHPYEEIAYDLYPLVNQGRIYSLGRKGNLESPVSLQEFARLVKERLELDCIRIVGDLEHRIKKAAVVSGAGSGYISMVKAQGIDLLVTGDLKYHEAREAELLNLAVIDAGHQGTEEIAVPYLQHLLEKECRSGGYELQIEAFKLNQCIKTIS